jgi:ATP-binding cassette subfamily F protein uup
MDKVVDHLFVFRGEGIIEDFPGNYSDFRSYEDSTTPTKQLKSVDKTVKTSWKKETKVQLSFNEQKEYNRLEKDIQKIDKEKKELENSFATKEYTTDEIQEVSKKIKQLSDAIDEKEMRWFELSAKLEGE